MTTIPTITLTTDFGHEGPFVAVMKGAILSGLPEARIIDLTHEIHAHWPAEAGFWLARAYPWFPQGTVHIAVVDPGVGTERDIVALEHDGHVFIAPDNGLLPAALAGRARAFRLSQEWLRDRNWPTPSATFHGRDIFAPLAAGIAGGRVQIDEIGPPAGTLVPSLAEPESLGDGRISGIVVAIDHFGNLITNIDADHVLELDTPEVRVAGRVLRLRRTYGDESPGEYLALINSFRAVEIARAEGSAAEGLGLGRGTPVEVVESGSSSD